MGRMLGRYVILTVVILGLAMIYAPEPEGPRALGDRSTGAEAGAGLVPRVSEGMGLGMAGGAPTLAPTLAPTVAPDRQPDRAPDPGLADTAAVPAPQTPVQPPIRSVGDRPAQPPAQTTGPDPGALALGVEAALSQALRPVPDPRAGLFIVADTRVNLRAGPSTGFDVLRTLEPGDLVDILSETDGWAEVRVEEDGTIGHMARRFLVPAP